MKPFQVLAYIKAMWTEPAFLLLGYHSQAYSLLIAYVVLLRLRPQLLVCIHSALNIQITKQIGGGAQWMDMDNARDPVCCQQAVPSDYVIILISNRTVNN